LETGNFAVEAGGAGARRERGGWRAVAVVAALAVSAYLLTGGRVAEIMTPMRFPCIAPLLSLSRNTPLPFGIWNLAATIKFVRIETTSVSGNPGDATTRLVNASFRAMTV